MWGGMDGINNEESSDTEIIRLLLCSTAGAPWNYKRMVYVSSTLDTRNVGICYCIVVSKMCFYNTDSKYLSTVHQQIWQ